MMFSYFSEFLLVEFLFLHSGSASNNNSAELIIKLIPLTEINEQMSKMFVAFLATDMNEFSIQCLWERNEWRFGVRKFNHKHLREGKVGEACLSLNEQHPSTLQTIGIVPKMLLWSTDSFNFSFYYFEHIVSNPICFRGHGKLKLTRVNVWVMKTSKLHLKGAPFSFLHLIAKRFLKNVTSFFKLSTTSSSGSKDEEAKKLCRAFNCFSTCEKSWLFELFLFIRPSNSLQWITQLCVVLELCLLMLCVLRSPHFLVYFCVEWKREKEKRRKFFSNNFSSYFSIHLRTWKQHFLLYASVKNTFHFSSSSFGSWDDKLLVKRNTPAQIKPKEWPYPNVWPKWRSYSHGQDRERLWVLGGLRWRWNTRAKHYCGASDSTKPRRLLLLQLLEANEGMQVQPLL